MNLLGEGYPENVFEVAILFIRAIPRQRELLPLISDRVMARETAHARGMPAVTAGGQLVRFRGRKTSAYMLFNMFTS